MNGPICSHTDLDQRQQNIVRPVAIERGVEGEVGLDHRLGVVGLHRRVGSAVERVEPAQEIAVGARQGAGGGLALQQRARGDQLLEAARRHLRHAHAAIVEQHQRPLGHQPAQRLAHRHGGDAERIGEPADGHRLAGREAPGHHGAPQLAEHPLLKGLAVEARLGR